MKHDKNPNVFGPGLILDQLTDYFDKGGHTRSGIYNRLSEIYSLGFSHGLNEFKRKSIKMLKKTNYRAL